MSESVFLKPAESYIRDIDPMGHYIEQSASYLATMTGDSIEVCTQFIKDKFKTKELKEAIDPTVEYYQREENGDRSKHTGKLSHYIYNVIKQNEVLAPSFTVYQHPSQRKSLLVGFVDKNVKLRSKAKKEAFKAKAEKNNDLYIIKNNEQTNKKLSNNSLSGAFVTKGSILNNPTAHSTLTSITRSVSSFGNASNERIIAGNRHYWSPDTALNNIIAIASNSDFEIIERVMTKYNLHYPTPEEVIDCMTYSSNLYWYDHRAVAKIFEYVKKLTPLQCAAFVYTGDLYHLRVYNDAFMRMFLSELSHKTYKEVTGVADKARKIDEQVMNLAHQLCSDEVRGKGKDYDRMEEDGTLKTLVPTAVNIIDTVTKYKDFIEAFFLSMNVPATIAYVPNMIRRAVVLSDTDSTCFSTDEWVKWYYGSIVFNSDALGLASAVAYIATQSIAHTLAVFSANINVERDRLHVLACKPEWVWTAFMLTSVSKHYAASAIIQEANVSEKMEMEIKGVHLKSSNAPPSLTKQAKELMRSILVRVTSNQKISMIEHLRSIADTERRIKESLLNGQLEFYRQSKIKEAAGYSKAAELSPYQHHLLWREVFEPKYGIVEEPPYSVAKVPTILDTPTALKNWLLNMEDKELANRLSVWLIRNNKTSLPTMYLSTTYLKGFGMPPEIRAVIDTKRIVRDLINVFYIITESLGFYVKEGYILSEMGY